MIVLELLIDDCMYLIIIEFNSPGVFLSKKAMSCLRIDTNNAFLSIKSFKYIDICWMLTKNLLFF
jgi:hypothetical protein